MKNAFSIRIETKLFVIRLCDCNPNRKNALKPFSFCVFILDFKSSLCLVRDESFSFYLVCMYFLFKYRRKALVKSYFPVTFIPVEYLWYGLHTDWIQLHAFIDSKRKKQHEEINILCCCIMLVLRTTITFALHFI